MPLAIKSSTNKIYVANLQDGTVTVIDGATNSTAVLSVGTRPTAVAVNPVTNKIYVADKLSNTVTIIDEATNSTETVTVGQTPVSVAVNPVTNKIYVGNNQDVTVTVIDGATTSTLTVPLNTTCLCIKNIAVDFVTKRYMLSIAQRSRRLMGRPIPLSHSRLRAPLLCS